MLDCSKGTTLFNHNFNFKFDLVSKLSPSIIESFTFGKIELERVCYWFWIYFSGQNTTFPAKPVSSKATCWKDRLFHLIKVIRNKNRILNILINNLLFTKTTFLSFNRWNRSIFCDNQKTLAIIHIVCYWCMLLLIAVIFLCI